MSQNTIPAQAKAVAFTGHRQVQLIDWPVNAKPLDPHEVAGRTIVTLISPGTEINWAFDKPHDKPVVGGYAAIFEIDAVGAEVRHLRPGQRAFCLGNHLSRQRHPAANAIPLPDHLAPEVAAFARMMGVSWSTLTTTPARPPDRVLVLGLGVIGNLAAQTFAAAGYRVTGIDPSEPRRQLAAQCGILHDIRPSALNQPDLQDQVTLAIDCSGHEQAVADALKIVRKGGEVVLVGVPWKQRADVQSFEIIHAIFHRYVTLRSGWEWEVPFLPRDFSRGSMIGNMAGALEWLAQKRVNVDALYNVLTPNDAQQAYEDLMHQRGRHLSTIIDWRTLNT